MGISFTGLGAASAAGKYPKMDLDGNYVMEVRAIKLAPSFKSGGESYVIEATVVESDNPAIRPGQDRSVTINRLDSSKKHEREAAMGNLKGFLAAAFSSLFGQDIDPELPHPGDGDMQGWEKLAKDSLVDDGAGVAGAKFRLKVVNTKTQAGFNFAKPFFSKVA